MIEFLHCVPLILGAFALAVESLPSPTAWQLLRSLSSFPNQQVQKKDLTCGGGKRLLSKVPDGCEGRQRLRSCFLESSMRLPEEQMLKVTVGEALLEVRHRS